MNVNGNRQSFPSLCIDCGNTCNGCPWASKQMPVDGWKAEPVKKEVTSFKGMKGLIDSFRVIECPNFKKYERLKEV